MKQAALAIYLLLSGIFYAQTFTSGTGNIYDNQSIDIPITVVGLPNQIDTVNFGLEQVCLSITHTWDADLTISLVSPDGTVKSLAASVGGDGDNFTSTCFLTTASTAITSGTAPFTGSFIPQGQMGAVNNGQNPNGTWFLRISDGYSGDEGILQSCSLTFGSNPAKYFQFTSSLLPIVVINTNGNTIVDSPKVMADMGIIANNQGNRNYLTDLASNYDGKIGIEIRGNYSASLPQKPYGFETWDVNGNAIDSSLLGMPAENDWILTPNYNDKSFARNILAFHFFEDMGHYSVRTRLVDVVINGEYKGIYLLSEKIKRDVNRVDISKLNPTEIVFPDVSGGFMLKIDYWDNSNSWQLNYSPIGYPGLPIHLVNVEPDFASLVPQQSTYIHQFVDDFETALYGSNFAHPVVGYRGYIGTTSFIDYFLVNEVTRNIDGFKKSRFFFKDKDKSDGTIRKLKAGPVWDFDWSQKDINQGSTDGSGFMYPLVDQDVDAPGWYIRLLQDTLFANELRCRYDDLRRGSLSLPSIHAKIDSVANLVAESQAWHYKVWGSMGAATGTPEVQAPSQTFAEEVQRLKDWYSRRLAWLDINMPGTLNGCSMTGLQELADAHQIQVYPNPFNNVIVVEWTAGNFATFSYVLRDGSARTVAAKSNVSIDAKENSFVIDNLSGLTNGMYYLELSSGNERVILKVCK